MIKTMKMSVTKMSITMTSPMDNSNVSSGIDTDKAHL
jgi:hypothetical protein